MLVQFGNNWIQKIPLTAKLDSAYGLVQFWLSSEFFSSNYFQIGQHVVLLHILMVIGTLKSHDLGKGILLLNRSNFSAAFTLFFSSTSVYLLALVSMERAFAVLRLIRHRIKNRRVYIYSIVIVWAIALVFFGLYVIPLLSRGKWVICFCHW